MRPYRDGQLSTLSACEFIKAGSHLGSAGEITLPGPRSLLEVGAPSGKRVGFWHKTFPPFNKHSLYARGCLKCARNSPKHYTCTNQLLSPHEIS